MANGIRTVDSHGFNKGCSSKFHEGSRVQQTPNEGWRTYRPKHCGNNNKDEDNSLKTLNDKKITKTPEEGRRIYQPKHNGNNNKDEDNSPKSLNDKKITKMKCYSEHYKNETLCWILQKWNVILNITKMKCRHKECNCFLYILLLTTIEAKNYSANNDHLKGGTHFAESNQQTSSNANDVIKKHAFLSDNY